MTKAKIKIPLIDKEDRWVARNLFETHISLLPDNAISFYQERFQDGWKDEITDAFCSLSNWTADQDRFKYRSAEINNQTTWFVEYTGPLSKIKY